MTEHRTRISDLSSLEAHWERGLQFGILVADLSPEPSAGVIAQVELSLPWCGQSVLLKGEVVEANGPHAVLELTPFDSGTLESLLASGLEAAGAELGISAEEAANRAAQGRSQAESFRADGLAAAEPVPPELQTADLEPLGPEMDALLDSGAAASATEAERALAGQLASEPAPAASGRTAPSKGPARSPIAQGAVGPVAKKNVHQAEPPQPTGDPSDIATVAAADGPASLSAEGLLSPATQHGDFSKISWPEVLLHFYERRATGVLAIEGFREIRWCYILGGQPLHYLGDHPHPGEFLSDILVGEGWVSSDDWLEAMQAQKLTGILAGEYLVRNRKVERLQLNRALSVRAERITRKLMGMNYGSFRFHPYPQLMGLFPWDPVPVLQLVMDEQRSALAAVPDEALIGRVASLYAMHVRLVPSRAELLRELRLNDQERHLVDSVLPASWPLSELVALDEMSEARLVRFLLTLSELGLVEFARDEGPDNARDRATRECYAMLSSMTDADEFEVLGLHWTAVTEGIELAHEELIQRFSEARFADVMDNELQELLSQIRSRLDTAYKALVSVDARRRHRKAKIGAGKVRMAAEILLDQAKAARSASNFPLVKACCERILELSPEGSEGRELMARARKWLSDGRLSSVGELTDEDRSSLRQNLARLR